MKSPRTKRGPVRERNGTKTATSVVLPVLSCKSPESLAAIVGSL